MNAQHEKKLEHTTTIFIFQKQKNKNTAETEGTEFFIQQQKNW